MAQLNIENLSYSFGKLEIIRDIQFNLSKGQMISVVGPSGSGKTTLLRLCAGLMELDEGTVENGFSSSAFVFQDPRLLPWQNVIDNITLGLRARRVEKSLALQKAQAIALKFGLDAEDFYKYPAELSGGMRQRVAFARAFILEPELLFLDEPFSALDIGLKRELQDHLVELAEKNNMSVLFITHDLMEAVRLSDKMLVLQGTPGRIAHCFDFNAPQAKRDDNYVFGRTANLLQHPVIQLAFELQQQSSASNPTSQLDLAAVGESL